MNTISNEQLRELVQAGLIDDATAARIGDYYLQKKQSRPNTFAILLWILGAVLIGSGIVLIVAHNWDNLSKPTRTFLALFPLALAQGFCFFVLRYRFGNNVLKEISAVFLFFAIAAAISLIGQIYQIDGTLAGFLQTWILLTLPLVYLLRSQALSLLIISLATWHICLTGISPSFFTTTEFSYLYFVVIIALVPNYLRLVQDEFSKLSFHFHNWLFVISIIIALIAIDMNTHVPAEINSAAYMGLFVSLFLVGKLPPFRNLRANAFLIAGRLGVLFILLTRSYQEFWTFGHSSNVLSSLIGSALGFITILFSILIIYILFALKKANRDTDAWLMSAMFYIFCLTILLFGDYPSPGIFILNLCLLAISIFYIRKGAQSDHLPTLNFGILIIAALAIVRFFDDNIPFVIRGIFFLITGIGFFAANYLMIRKRKQLNQSAEL